MTSLFRYGAPILPRGFALGCVLDSHAERPAFTWAYCTSAWYWYDCSWPQWRSAR
jgi:hypothetical protein